MKINQKSTLILAFTLLMLLFSNVQAEAADVEMADQMRANGMIYVVITVLSIIFTGIIIFLFLIERRLKKLEKSKK